ncbi:MULTISPECIES: cation-translocating P-type ATPase [Lactiplantibacillus]|uniref:P-type Ca(2+) transporter n=1 Tax=Lactiplantibacillus pentosus TaxID=1589 RepID=A0AAW8WJL7_LACPE|nr:MULTISPECIES: cation-translocating P-type ATPase [Lactiplantibacillus]MBU7461236.1 cation-translocating P-type ATPase [Lactiplantibacillus pentosus]MBU7478162.1 cation-translocating P-type ATPase [Lactiplantibacillus pentosus]MBU7483847.1 cation-translocating P-type ATPase [Lactiplantibacillus sp. 30.2.29]MBU7487135.1 cation-translocating P-type ATPase [Lactiplantibacillus pentosus]MBU7500168.1 cation-translocating P-type ATPase [Lactiplantibacillus pentosus]
MSTKPEYQQSLPAIYQELETDEHGLQQSAATQRLEQYGPNALNQQKTTSLLQKFIAQFKDFMIIVLLVAALIAAFTGEAVDAVIILLVVVLNAIFGVFQESKAEEAINALKEMSAPDATVLRDGQLQTVKSDALVPGDIVSLEAGDIVPADLRLIESASLKVEESTLTGESVPVEKQAEMVADGELPIGDRLNMAYMNSNVTYGRATGIVVATGMQTEVGRIAGMIEAADETTTPLQANLTQLGKSLTILILVIAAVVFGIGMLRGQESLINMLLTAISLAVAAIPEGLPAIVTITLALGTQRMAKRHALVRKLPAVETLGSTDIIASDKTGTLTQNKMTVEKLVLNQELVDARTTELPLDSHLAQVMILSNDTKIMSDGLAGDPTETALIQYNLDQNYPVDQLLEQRPRVNEVPFDSERKLMSTVHPLEDGRFLVAVKGAPDELLKRVTQVETNGEVEPLTKTSRDQILSVNHELATQALRVLAFAYKIVTSVPATVNSDTLENDLIFAGMVGMIDPERPEVEQAVAEAKSAGIRPLMITGDHRDTAEAIAVRLGIIDEGEDDAVITGAELDAMSDDEFGKKVGDYSVYARVAPEHKVRIVNAWQKRGKVVAMTGDGVNDAPALKAADIGIGMGITGTEVSKGASDMVLADDNFATIVVAVEEGRKVFANIQKAIQYLLSANLGEVLTLFVMTMLGWQILAPVHILWINLVTDTLPAIALGVEPTEKNIMQHKPRGRNSNFFSGGVFSSIIYQGLLEGGITLFVYWMALTYPVHASASLAHADALTMAFATLGLIQLFHAFNSKSIHESLFTVGLFRNKFFNWAVLIAFVMLAITIVVPGLNGLFHVTHLDAYQWGIVAAAALSMVIIVEIVKFFQRRHMRRA